MIKILAMDRLPVRHADSTTALRNQGINAFLDRRAARFSGIANTTHCPNGHAPKAARIAICTDKSGTLHLVGKGLCCDGLLQEIKRKRQRA
jgi:hypothetical protein